MNKDPRRPAGSEIPPKPAPERVHPKNQRPDPRRPFPFTAEEKAIAAANPGFELARQLYLTAVRFLDAHEALGRESPPELRTATEVTELESEETAARVALLQATRAMRVECDRQLDSATAREDLPIGLL